LALKLLLVISGNTKLKQGILKQFIKIKEDALIHE